MQCTSIAPVAIGVTGFATMDMLVVWVDSWFLAIDELNGTSINMYLEHAPCVSCMMMMMMVKLARTPIELQVISGWRRLVG